MSHSDGPSTHTENRQQRESTSTPDLFLQTDHPRRRTGRTTNNPGRMEKQAWEGKGKVGDRWDGSFEDVSDSTRSKRVINDRSASCI